MVLNVYRVNRQADTAVPKWNSLVDVLHRYTERYARQARSTQVASGDTMRKDCARLIYYSCFFIACFACLGTFASFLLGKSTESLNHEANEYVKILCPSVLVLSFVVMWLVRCSTKKSGNNSVQQTIPYGVNQPVAGNNPAYLCDDIFLGIPPSYDETMNSIQLHPIEPPPKYEDIARHGWKPEDRSQQEHSSQHRTATRAEIFTITLPGRSVNSERSFASGRDIVIHRGAPREEVQGSERESRDRSCPLTNHPLERGIIASSGGMCQIE